MKQLSFPLATPKRTAPIVLAFCGLVLILAILSACKPAANYPRLTPPDTPNWHKGPGWSYTVIRPGNAEAPPARHGQKLTVHYVGAYDDGVIFDSSRQRQVPFSFVLGDHKVMAGWEGGLQGMRQGEVRYLIVSPAAAFGEVENGPIAPNTSLHYEVELIRNS